MNARQTKKFLKKQINRLESDNDLMRRIIADSPKMQEVYDAYTKPLNVQYTTMQFQKFKARRMFPDYLKVACGFMDYAKEAVAKDLFKGIKDNITYEIDAKCETTTITASIYVGRKER